ncbi:MAG TPA: 50S ribosomal protein L13 [Candidatus Gracilibacteria bacterium]|nr:50S ribosomal protein L13 [Candidatus Gracilibacteria bacterium]
MKTFSPKKADLTRKWYLVDAKGQTLGKLATEVANVLRGKNKPTFAPHVDCGDFVVIINAKDVKLTGAKIMQKKYYSHSRYPGGLKEQTAAELLEKHPERVLEKAIRGMIPPNKLRAQIISKLKIYAGEEHKHEAQQPETLTFS